MNAQAHAVISQQPGITADARSVTAFSASATLIKTRTTEFIEQRLSHFQENAADFLFELAEKTRDEDLNYLYLDTISRLRNKRDILKKSFFTNFEIICKNSSTSQPATGIAFTADSAAIDKLLLNGNDDLEAVIAMKNIAEQVQRRYATELSALHTAMQTTQRPSLTVVSPVVLCIAWKQTTDTLKLSVKAKFVVYKLFSKFVLEDLGTLYQSLLVEMGSHSPVAPSAQVADVKNPRAEGSTASAGIATPAGAPTIDAPIENKLHGRKLPEAVHQFLFTIWSEVLVQVKTQKGTDSPAWTGAMQVIDDLAAVTQFKQTPQSSARLLEIIPRLLCNLQNGLSLVSYEKQKKEQLFNQLLALHARAIQNRKAQSAS